MTAASRELGTAEQEYVDHVADQLRWIPRRQRENLLDVLRQNLAERAGSPRSTGWQPTSAAHDVTRSGHAESLRLALGSPADYAATLVAEMEQADPGFTARARTRGRWSVTALLTAVVLVLGSAVVGFSWWLTWDPGFRSVMDRICYGQPTVNRCEANGITDLAPADMVQVSCLTGRTLDIEIGVVADRAVTVTGASLAGGVGVGNIRPDGPPFATQTFRLTEIEPWLRPDTSSLPERSAWPARFDNNALIPEVHFVMDLCPPDGDPPLPPGGSLIFEDFELHYRALGRDRVATVAFPRAIAITRFP